MGKILYFNHEALLLLLLQAGVDELANPVKVTLGPNCCEPRRPCLREIEEDAVCVALG